MIAFRKRPFQEDKLNSSAYKQLKIRNISDMKETLSKYLDTEYMYSKQLDTTVFHKIEEIYLSVSKITDFIRIDDKLHVRQLITQ